VSSLAYRPVSSCNIIYNSQTPPLIDIVRFDLLRIVARFSNTSVWERFLHSYKGCFVSLFNRFEISQSTLPVSSLTYCPVSSFDIIYNSQSPPLTDIVRFDLLRIAARFSNASVRERFPHPYKGCFVSLFNRCEISQSTPLGGLVSSLAHPLFYSC